MEELWPQPSADVDIEARLAGDHRPKPPGRPWVCMVMISSIDGAIAVDGVSGALGGPSDHRRFVAARRLADAIVVGAGTIAAENYRPASVPLAVVTGSLSVDRNARLFGDPKNRPLLYTTTQAASSRGADFDGVADVVDVGDSIRPLHVLADLDSREMKVVVLEGGPTLNGHFFEDDVVDELLVSVAPMVAGGDAPRMVTGAALETGRSFVLDRVVTGDGLVFLRYLRDRS